MVHVKSLIPGPRRGIGDEVSREGVLDRMIEILDQRELPAGVGIHIEGIKPFVARIELPVAILVNRKALAADVVLIGEPLTR